MFFVGHENMADEWTLGGQERNSELNSFAMPILAVFALISDAFNHFVLLVEETELSAETEVAHAQETHLFENVLACEFDYRCV